MTDKDIIKALECCKKDDCDNCPNTFGNCYANLAGYALDLINQQQAEIEGLEKRNITNCRNWQTKYNSLRAEAVKEFADRLKNEIKGVRFAYEAEIQEQIDNLVNEMVGE